MGQHQAASFEGLNQSVVSLAKNCYGNISIRQFYELKIPDHNDASIVARS
jgi:hypothetical protein